MDVLVQATELPVDERDAFLQQACGNDTALRDEVRSLLQHHSTKTIAPEHTRVTRPNTVSKRANLARHASTSGTDASTSRRTFWAVVAVLVCLSGFAWWIRGEIQDSLRADLRDDVLSVLDADVRIIRNWITEQRNLAETWASHSEIQRLTEQLVKITEASASSSARDELLTADAFQPLLTSLKLLKRQHKLAGANIFSRSGVCLAHTREDMIGAPVAPAGGTYLRRVVLGETIYVKPTKEKLYVVGFDPYIEGPLVGMAAPIRDRHGVIIGGLAFAFPLKGEYSAVMGFTSTGWGDETFAFDRDFTMLSHPNQPQLLVEKGLLSDISASQLNVRLRVPRRLGNKYTYEGQPPTWTATAAVERGGGINLDGYTNYLGQPVIGASKWLEDLDFGICKEILVSEAFRPVHDVERLTLGLLALTGVVTGLAIFTSFRNVRLQDAISDKRQIGSYILGDKIGEGGMGTIYECQHALLRRPTAMKLLDGHKADPDTLARFEREVQIASELTHPNTVQIYDFGRTEDDVFYIAMELLPGLDLNQLVKHSGAQSSPRVIHILRHAGQALLEAHRRGLIHRDIKPANIMLCERGGYFDFVKVLDYGLACSYVEDPNHELTRDGIVRGTPGYIAPERLSGKEDVRGDIFSLAAVAYYLLTGWPAFASPAADSLQSVLQSTLR